MIYQYLDALFFSLMVGAGEAFFSAYALEVGHGELEAGLIATARIVIGGIIQLLAPFGINKIKSYKAWTLAGVFLQSLIFVCFVVFDKYLRAEYSLLFALVVLYWSLTLGITSSWNTWIARLVETTMIRKFFSTRNIIMASGTLIGLVFSGLLLYHIPEKVGSLPKYHFIFLICFGLRFMSFLSLTKHRSVEFKPIENFTNSFKIIKTDARFKFIYHFILFSSFIKVGVFFSATFFGPYMLKQLNFSYLEYMLILVSAYSGRILLGQIIKRFIDKFDINKLYLIASIGIGLIPMFWILSKDFSYIFILEIFTGLLWGSFEIAFFVTTFEEIPSENQGQMMTLYNLIHTICIGLGCFMGAFTFYYLGNHIQSYHIIFFVSGLLRISSVLFFPRKKLTESKVLAYDLVRLTGVRPNMGMISRPFWQAYGKVKKHLKQNESKDKSQ